MTETIATRSGLALEVGAQARDQTIEIHLRLKSQRNCVLHWGLRQPGQEGWRLPPQETWPARTQLVAAAAQTPFAREAGQENVLIRLPAPAAYSSLDFVLFFPDQRAWDNNGGQNYRIQLPGGAPPAPQLDSALKQYIAQKKALFQRVFELEPYGRLAVVATREDGRFAIQMLSDIPGLLLHWGPRPV